MRTRQRHHALYIALCGALVSAAIALTYDFGPRAERADFPNEGKLISSKISMESPIRDIGGVLGFRPDVFCFSLGGEDPRIVYNSSKVAKRKLEVPNRQVWLEGYAIFLFVGNDEFYIEKFDHTDVYFDQLTKSQCIIISDSFSLSFKQPTNRIVYSRYSGFVDF